MKRFHGWEPERVTVYDYGDAEGVQRSVTTTETEWDEEQQALVLALLGVEADTCSGCGLPLSETTQEVIGPDGEPDPDASMRQYVAKPTHRCYGCVALHRLQKDAESLFEPDSLRLTIQKRGGL